MEHRELGRSGQADARSVISPFRAVRRFSVIDFSCILGRMLKEIPLETKELKKYEGIVSGELLGEIHALAEDIKGIRVAMVNSTSEGGGVAEILHSLVPLLRSAGIHASWHVIPGDEAFFSLTKEIHNALQGKNHSLPPVFREKYRNHMEMIARSMREMSPDIWVIHDPQPLGVVDFLPDIHPCISHIHIDTSNPHKDVWNFLSPYIRKYDRVIFSNEAFRQEDIPAEKTAIMFPAIDPLTEKNKCLSKEESVRIIGQFGINTNNPLISQISRFDPWKNPMGVVRIYKMLKKSIPSLQLALVGLFLASDDPEAEKVYREVEKETKNDPDVFLFSDPRALGELTVDTFVNAFQSGSDVVLQYSTREGFGLTVSEAMWKEKVVVGRDIGGIKVQITHGENGFLVSDSRQAAETILRLLNDRKRTAYIGKEARKAVARNFLMPRLVRDYVALLRSIK